MTEQTRTRKAIILAAGAGRRLGAFTDAHPKPLLEINGVSILGNCLQRLSACGVEEVVIVVGHFREQIVAFAGQTYLGMRVRYVVSELFASTNNIYSLWLARDALNEDVLLIEADIFFDENLLPALQRVEAENVAAVAPFARGMDGSVVRLDSDGFLTCLIEGREQEAGFDYSAAFKTVNIYRLGRDYLAGEFVPALERAINEGRVGDYYELILKETLARGTHKIRALDCANIRWYEIDDHIDRAIAEYKFLPPSGRKAFLDGEYGTYWRYDCVDHAYIYNPYFPTADLWRRLKTDFEDAAKQYPAGQKSLAQAASLAFGIPAENLAIANGASELIRIVCGQIGGRVIVAVPSFNEFENATVPENLIRFDLAGPDFRFDVDAFAERAREGRANIAIVVSPNNPTSLSVPRVDLIRLCETLERNGTLLLLDESFVDFSDDPASFSLAEDAPKHANLAILKSLSKVYGIAGLRLGYLYSANADFMAAVRKALPIWNINGLAEDFLRLLPRYRAEFAASCRQVRADTNELYELLRAIPGGYPNPPQANFVFWRLPERISASELVARLFAEHNILIKDCSQKTMQGGAHYVRIAARTPVENRRLVEALRAILGSRA